MDRRAKNLGWLARFERRRSVSGTLRREELLGFSYGILFVSIFAFVWASLGSSAFPRSSGLLLALSAFVSLSLIFAAFYLRRASRSAPRMPEGSMSPAVWRRFQIVGIVEGAAIGVAVFVLVRAGRPEWIPAVVALIVGLHFFPLAPLFRVRMYYVTGSLLCAIFVLTFVLAPLSGSSAVWFAVPGLGAALVLWATGALLASSGISGLSGITRSGAGSK